MRAAVPLPPLLLLLAACAGAPPAGDGGEGAGPEAPGAAPRLAEDYLRAREALGGLVPPPRPPAGLQR